MEKDDEVEGQGNSYTTQFRAYDPRLGKWLSLDPLMDKYPSQSPYVAFNNNPLFYNDPSGLEGEDPYGKLKSTETTEDVVSIATYDEDAEKNKNKYIIIQTKKTTKVYEAHDTYEEVSIRRITTIKIEKVSIIIIDRYGKEIDKHNRISIERETHKVERTVSYPNSNVKPYQPPTYLSAPKISTLIGKDTEITKKLKQAMVRFKECAKDAQGHYDLHAKLPTESVSMSLDQALGNVVIGKIPYLGSFISFVNDLNINNNIIVKSKVSLHHYYQYRPRSVYIHNGYKPDVHDGILDNKENETRIFNQKYQDSIYKALYGGW